MVPTPVLRLIAIRVHSAEQCRRSLAAQPPADLARNPPASFNGN
jgi:hypothetical protein